MLSKIEYLVDASDAGQTASARRLKRVVGLMFVIYGVVLQAIGVAHGDLLVISPAVLIMAGVAFFVGRGGRFIYYFVPAFLGIWCYFLAGQFVSSFKLSVHYTPQIKLEQWLIPGPLPTLWLQHHLYHGTTGPLEIFAAAMYVSHFWVPVVLGFGLAIAGRGKAFATLMFSFLAASILAEIIFVLAPTAPPWLAAEKGYVPPVHHILKDSFYDLHLTKLANFVGNSGGYDVTAAIPSLHIAFPVICVLTAWAFRLPRWVQLVLVLDTLGVAFTIVYTGDHYVVDALAGVLCALLAWLPVYALLAQRKQENVEAITSRG